MGKFNSSILKGAFAQSNIKVLNGKYLYNCSFANLLVGYTILNTILYVVRSRLLHGIFMMCHVFIFGNQLTKMDRPIKQDDNNFVILMLNISFPYADQDFFGIN